MKKLILTAITIISMACVTYADNGNATFPYTNDGITVSVEKAGPHTKQYRDLKEILDKYEREVKGATSCEDIYEAENSFSSSVLLMTFDSDYDYDEADLMTDEEAQELEKLYNRIDDLKAQKEEQYGCKSDLDEEYSLTPTTTKEWDELISGYEDFVSQMEKLSKKKLASEEYLQEFLKLLQDNMDLITRIENSDPSSLTERQNERITKLNEKIEVLGKKMGLDDDD